MVWLLCKEGEAIEQYDAIRTAGAIGHRTWNRGHGAMESYAEDYEDQHQNLRISDVIGHNSVK